MAKRLDAPAHPTPRVAEPALGARPGRRCGAGGTAGGWGRRNPLGSVAPAVGGGPDGENGKGGEGTRVLGEWCGCISLALLCGT